MRSLLFAGLCLALLSPAQELYKKRPDANTRWATFENPTAAKGAAGSENKTAKGHAFDPLKAGETKTLLNVSGSGSVRHIWVTLRDRDPEMLRSLRLEVYWGGARTPAVSVPFGDFFGAIHGRPSRPAHALVVNAEGG